MQLGIHMRELWGQKLGLAIAVLLAVLAATRALYGIGLFPPSLERHSVGLAGASTQVLVDTPRSTVVDLREDTYSITGLTNRALLLGNVIASLPVRQHIAQRTGVPVTEIKVAAPLTADEPRAIANSAQQPATADILNSPDEYRLSVRANPTVPVLDVYAEAGKPGIAVGLANAAVDGLRDYLRELARDHMTPRKEQVRLIQLGRAKGSAVNSGANLQLAVLTFIFVFAVCCAAVLFIARVRRGWRASGDSVGDLSTT